MGFIACQHFDLFDRSVLAVIGMPEEDALVEFRKFAEEKNVKLAHLENVGGAKGWCQDADGDVFIWVRDLDNPSTFLHEIVHAAFRLCELCGIGINEELICRIVGELKRGIFDDIYHRCEDKPAPKKGKK